MKDFLLRRFVKDYENVEKVSVRTAYGVLSGVVGILCNLVLFAVKAVSGIALHSVSVSADAFNNLTDVFSSAIGFAGMKMAEKPADTGHPFGHGRIEYISALIVSFIVIQVGFTFFKDSVSKILHPQNLNFRLLPVAFLALSVGVKLWLALFNRKLGKKINSKVLLAVFTDSMGDMLTTSATIISLIFYAATRINIDGYVGIGVSAVVMWAGIGIARDTLRPLIGGAGDPELGVKIEKFVEKYDGIVGSHDLIVHDYGPGRSMASIHAEVPNNVNIEVSHEIIDRIEKEAKEQLGIFLVIHMDPIETEDETILRLKALVSETLQKLDPECSIHDFRLVDGVNQINLIFDMLVPVSYSEADNRDLEERLKTALSKTDPRLQCVITTEYSYVLRRGQEKKKNKKKRSKK